MEALWFWLVLALFGTYAIVNGFDLGSGLIYLFLTRDQSERRPLMNASENNALWLVLAAIGLTGAIPSVFSIGFVFAAALLVSLCIVRRFCSLLHSQFGDRAFGWATLGAMLAFGFVVGTVIASTPSLRGTPAAQWIPILCTICTMSIFTLQSAAWTAMNATGALQARCRTLASVSWWAVLASYVLLAAAAISTGSGVLDGLLQHSWMCGFAVTALAGLLGSRLCLGIGFDLGVVASAACITASLLATTAAGAFATATGGHPISLGAAALWTLLALSLTAAYQAGIHKLFGTRIASAKSQTASSRASRTKSWV